MHKIKQNLSRTSTDVIYLITYKNCKVQYVGQKCANRINNHKFDTVQFPDTFTNVSEHFNAPGHIVCLQTLSFSIIFSFLFKGIQSSTAYNDLISYVP